MSAALTYLGATARRTFPSPRGHWLWGNLPQYRQDPNGFLQQLWNTYGDYSRFRVSPNTFFHLLAHPDAVEHVLQRHPTNYHKLSTRQLLFGNSVASSEGVASRQQRLIIQPAYSRIQVAASAIHVIAAAQKFVRRQAESPGAEVHLGNEMTRLMLEMAVMTLFGKNPSDSMDSLNGLIQNCLAYMAERSASSIGWFRRPSRKNRLAYLRSRSELARIMREIIVQRAPMEEKPNDVLTMLLTQREKIPNTISVKDLEDNLVCLLTASYVTMAEVMTWAFHYLGRHPSIQEDAHQEISAQLRGAPPSAEDASRLPLVCAIFEEAMRLYPSFNLTHHTQQADTIQGYSVPAKSRVILSPLITHRHPDFWENPNRFDPQRFLSGRPFAHKFAYFPFGAGPRICIGKALAMTQGPLTLAAVLQKLRIGETAPPPNAVAAFWPR